MAFKEALLAGGLTASVLLTAACSGGVDETVRETKHIGKCHYDETNVIPTYVPGTEGYQPTTDPNLIAQYQKEHLGKDEYLWGVGTLVCSKIVDNNILGADKEAQFLTQDAIQLGTQMVASVAQATPSTAG